MTIQPAIEADIPDINALVNSAYRGEEAKKGWTTEADLLDGSRVDEAALCEIIQNPQAAILKYEEAGNLLGCVYVEKKDDTLYLGMLTVSPDRQTGGIGRKLLNAAEKKAVNAGCKTVTMTVISVRYELIAWYERRGYRSTGDVLPFPSDPRFGTPKQPLSFIVMEKVL